MDRRFADVERSRVSTSSYYYSMHTGRATYAVTAAACVRYAYVPPAAGCAAAAAPFFDEIHIIIYYLLNMGAALSIGSALSGLASQVPLPPTSPSCLHFKLHLCIRTLYNLTNIFDKAI